MVTLAIDPGGTTGICWRNDEGELGYGQIRGGLGDVVRWLDGFMENKEGIIICEDFETAGRISKHGIATVQIVGAVKAIGLLKGWHVYTPVPQMRYAKRMDAERIAPKGHEWRHQRDALAHLLAYEGRRELGGYR